MLNAESNQEHAKGQNRLRTIARDLFPDHRAVDRILKLLVQIVVERKDLNEQDGR